MCIIFHLKGGDAFASPPFTGFRTYLPAGRYGIRGGKKGRSRESENSKEKRAYALFSLSYRRGRYGRYPGSSSPVPRATSRCEGTSRRLGS